MTHSSCFVVTLWRKLTSECAANIPNMYISIGYIFVTTVQLMILADVFSTKAFAILSDSSR